jgi:hypothetical protein
VIVCGFDVRFSEKQQHGFAKTIKASGVGFDFFGIIFGVATHQHVIHDIFVRFSVPVPEYGRAIAFSSLL